MAKKVAEPPIVSIDGVVTARGLAAMGARYAIMRSDRGGECIQITPEGHALIGEQLRERAQRGTTHESGVRYQPDIVHGRPERYR